ncbi:MAG: glycoside hydrolase family 65 protein [Minwuiales bacterium]|nr:glycoside hydrolase family 65 protein [Minwuiales bacterium]
MTGWSLVYDRFDPEKEGVREALCTLGNGYFATRGAASEATADEIHYPGTYLAGGYNRLTTRIAGRDIENEDLVNFPNWLPLTFRPDDADWFNLMAVEILAFRQELDLRRGILLRHVRYRDRNGRETEIDSERIVHMGDRHLAAASLTVTAINWSGPVAVLTALDGRVVNAGVERYRELNGSHLVPLEAGLSGDKGLYLIAGTTQSCIQMAQAAETRLLVDGREIECARRTVREGGYIGSELCFDVRAGQPFRVEKTVAIFTSRDRGIDDCGRAAADCVAAADSMSHLVASHAAAWEELWRQADLKLEDGIGRETLLLRLHIFHLLQTFSPNSTDLDVGIPARGLHGEAYRGHVFWDELFIFPFFNFRFPELSRALLMYRYRRLPEARSAARAAGLNGALFPWQSAGDGREESQVMHLNPRSGRWVPDHSHLQRHINAAVAFNVWNYVQTTFDLKFLASHGAEMILECARLWSDLTSYDDRRKRYQIVGIMGPDEYHDGYANAAEPGLRNNAYTNIMAVWVFCRALDVLRLLPADECRELRDRLELRDGEIERWDDISRRMRIVFFDDWIISQFEGYEELEELDWEGYRRKYGDIQRLDRILEAEGDTPNRYKLSKQADVLMLFYLFSAEELCALMNRLGYEFPAEAIPRNVAYYVDRTSNGSTLSHVVHSWVLARSDRSGSWSLFRQALESDVADIQRGTTKEGLHLGAMAATIDIVQRSYGGIDVFDQSLWFNPRLPDELRRLSMTLLYRRNRLDVSVDHKTAKISIAEGTGEPVEFVFRGEVKRIAPGRPVRVSARPRM